MPNISTVRLKKLQAEASGYETAKTLMQEALNQRNEADERNRRLIENHKFALHQIQRVVNGQGIQRIGDRTAMTTATGYDFSPQPGDFPRPGDFGGQQDRPEPSTEAKLFEALATANIHISGLESRLTAVNTLAQWLATQDD